MASELPEKVDFLRQNLETFKEPWQGGDGNGVKWFRNIDSLRCDGGLPISVDFTRGSLNNPFWGDQTMPMHGHFRGLPPY